MTGAGLSKTDPYLYIVCETAEQNAPCFTIELYDSKSRLVDHACRTCQKVTRFPVPRREEYRIKVISHGRIGPASASRWVVVNPLCSRTEYFLFISPPPGLLPSKAKFTLTDAYYPGLPIERGTLALTFQKSGHRFCIKNNLPE